MREAARALDDVSDHLGEVVRRADELLAEWARFGAQVRAQVDREAAAIGEVVDGAVARAAGTGLDRAIAERLRALTSELERLEQRTRAASRAVVEHRDADRRLLWIVIAGIAVANVLLVALLLRRPAPAPIAEPVRVESTTPPVTDPAPAPSPPSAPEAPAAGSAGTASGGAPSGAVVPVPAAGSGTPGGAPILPGMPVRPAAGAPTTPSAAPSAPPGARLGSAMPGAGAAAASAGGSAPAGSARPPADAVAPARPTASPIALPPRGGARPHKKLP